MPIQAARALSAEAIVQKSAGFAGPSGSFWPNIDGEIVIGDQYELYQAGRFNDVPVLIGSNSDEGALVVHRDVTPEQFDSSVRSDYDERADAILAAYPHATIQEATRSTKNIFREGTFAWHTWAWAQLQTQKGKGKVYLYYFDYHQPDQPEGASHGTEMAFIFGNMEGPGAALSFLKGAATDKDVAVAEALSGYWVNFAKTGDPNGPRLPRWPAYTTGQPQAMYLNALPSPGPVPNMREIRAFDAYYAWRRDEVKKRKQ